jgi:uncharacterized lipoprotein YmbA
MRHLPFAPVALVVGAILMLGGCASQPSRFYILSPLPSGETTPPLTSGQQSPTIGVGPVALPRYLDRPQIVTRTGPYELNMAEFDRWAEALDVNFSRVLADDLARLIPSAYVVVFPWPRPTTIDYHVTVEVTDFLSQVGGESLLVADWTLFRGEGREALLRRKSRFSAPAGGQGYAAVVAAMSRTVADLSREMAEAITGVGAGTSAR